MITKQKVPCNALRTPLTVKPCCRVFGKDSEMEKKERKPFLLPPTWMILWLKLPWWKTILWFPQERCLFDDWQFINQETIIKWESLWQMKAYFKVSLVKGFVKLAKWSNTWDLVVNLGHLDMLSTWSLQNIGGLGPSWESWKWSKTHSPTSESSPYNNNHARYGRWGSLGPRREWCISPWPSSVQGINHLTLGMEGFHSCWNFYLFFQASWFGLTTWGAQQLQSLLSQFLHVCSHSYCCFLLFQCNTATSQFAAIYSNHVHLQG